MQKNARQKKPAVNRLATSPALPDIEASHTKTPKGHE